MANQIYQELMQHYFSLQSEHKECMEQLTTLKAILSKFGNHVYEHFEEKQTWSEAFIKDCEIMGGEYENDETRTD